MHQEHDNKKGNEETSQDDSNRISNSVDMRYRNEVLDQYILNQLNLKKQNNWNSFSGNKNDKSINKEQEKCNSDNNDFVYPPSFFEKLYFTIENLFITKFTPKTLEFIFINRCLPISHPPLTLKKEKKSDYARIAVMLGFSCSEARNIFGQKIYSSDIPKTEQRFKNRPNPLYPSIMEFVKEFNLPFLYHKF